MKRLAWPFQYGRSLGMPGRTGVADSCMARCPRVVRESLDDETAISVVCEKADAVARVIIAVQMADVNLIFFSFL